jgi:glycosyltransferase involved in cell wall biosynthesis
MIPTYNQDKYIRKAIESALAQDYENKEIIVSIDCSTDNTFETVKEFSNIPKLKIINRKERLGRVQNYHDTLYNQTSGEWIINLDGDDFFLDNSYLSKAMALINKHPEIELVFANRADLNTINGVEIINPRIVSQHPELIDGNDIFINFPKRIYHLYHVTTLYKKKVALEIGYYEKEIINTDLESVLRYLPGRKIGFIQDVVACWRKHDKNESWNARVDDRVKNLDIAFGAYFSEINKQNFTQKELTDWLNKLVDFYSLQFIKRLISISDFESAILYVNQANKREPGLKLRLLKNEKTTMRKIFAEEYILPRRLIRNIVNRFGWYYP